jgi:small conductance mechanosensitive channel
MLTAFIARIGDSIHIVNDNIGGKVVEINFIFTKIITNEGAEYVVPNNAIVQGNVRITKGQPLYSSQLPYVEGDNIEVRDSSTLYCGTVSRITSNFTTLRHGDNSTHETILANSAMLSGSYVITNEIQGENNVGNS